MTGFTLTREGVVEPAWIDANGHMNVMWYVSKFDEALWSLFLAIGVAPSYLRSEARGMAALQQTIQYHRKLLAGLVRNPATPRRLDPGLCGGARLCHSVRGRGRDLRE